MGSRGVDGLERFVDAQDRGTHGQRYDTALAELRAGNKRGCWIWYVFPQFLDPNRDSINNRRFQLRSRAEAKEFLTHPVLGPRYMDAVKCATVAIAAQDVNKVMGWAVDSKKFHQSVTVLRLAAAEAGLEEEECILSETLQRIHDRPYPGQKCFEDPEMVKQWEEKVE